MQQNNAPWLRRNLRFAWETLFPYEIRWGTEEVEITTHRRVIEFSRLTAFDQQLVPSGDRDHLKHANDFPFGAVRDGILKKIS